MQTSDPPYLSSLYGELGAYWVSLAGYSGSLALTALFVNLITVVRESWIGGCFLENPRTLAVNMTDGAFIPLVMVGVVCRGYIDVE